MSPSARVSRRGRRLAQVSLCAMPLLLAGLVLGGRGRLFEIWHLHRLDSDDLEVRKHALEKLGEMASERAVTRLMELVRTDEELGPRAVAALTRGRDAALPELLSFLEGAPVHFLRRALAATSRDPSSPAARSVLLCIALRGPKEPLHEHVLWEAIRILKEKGELPVRELVEASTGRDEVVTERAIRILGSPLAADAVPALLRFLNHDKWSTQAGSSLAYIGAPAVPGLIESLSGASERERGEAARALERMGPSAAPAVPTLVRALGDSKQGVREQAARALGGIGQAAGEAVPALLRALEDPAFSAPDPPRDPDFGVVFWNGPPECYDSRIPVVHALGKAAPGAPEVVGALAGLLGDGNWCVAQSAASALGEMGPSAGAAASRLAAYLEKVLQAGSGDVWGDRWRSPRTAIDALARIGSTAPGVLSALEKALAREDLKDVSEAASRALARLGIKAQDVTPALIRALGHPDAGTVAHSADALRRMGGSVVPSLVDALRSEDPRVRSSAAHTLATLEADAAGAVPDLERLLADSDLEVRTAALRALDSLGALTEKALPQVLRALEENDALAQSTALRACRKLGRDAGTIVPVLLRMLDEGRSAWRREVPGVLASIAGTDPRVRPAILRAVEDVDLWVRLDAIRAVGTLGAKDDEAVAAVSRVLQERGQAANQADYYRVRESAAACLAGLGRGDIVLSALRSEDARVRSMAARALGDIRPRVPGAKEALEDLLLDERDEDAAREATQALRSLE